MFRVFRFPRAHVDQANLLLTDDTVSRQSVTMRDAKSLEMPGDDRYVVVEGSEAALARAVAIVKGIAEPLDGAQAEAVYRRFRSQDEEAASGMGLLFGP